MAEGGTKLDRISPCANRSAIQVASFTSVLRPGTFLMCAALASTNSKSSSKICHTGFQYTPVASIATCVQLQELSHSAKLNNPLVVVRKLRTSCCTGVDTQRTQATTTSLCTSRPAQRGYNTSMGSSSWFVTQRRAEPSSS